MTHAIVHLPLPEPTRAQGGYVSPAQHYNLLPGETGCDYIIPLRYFSSALESTLTTHQVRSEPDDGDAQAT